MVLYQRSNSWDALIPLEFLGEINIFCGRFLPYGFPLWCPYGFSHFPRLLFRPAEVGPCQSDLLQIYPGPAQTLRPELGNWEDRRVLLEIFGEKSKSMVLQMGVSIAMGVLQNGWFIVYKGNPIKMDDLGYPYFRKPSNRY